MALEVKVYFYKSPTEYEVIDKMEVESRETVLEVKSKLLMYYGLTDNPVDPFCLGTAMNPDPPGETPLSTLKMRSGAFLVFRRASVPPPPSPSTVGGVLLSIREGPSRKILLSTPDADRLGVDHGDLVRLCDPVSGLGVVGKVEVSAMLSQGACEVDQTFIDSLGSSEDMEVSAERFDSGKLRAVTGVTFGIRPIAGMSESDAVIHVRQKESALLAFMDKAIIMKGQKFRWDEANVLVYVLDTQPPLGADEVAMISNEILGEYSYQPWGVEPNFDGLLLIDLSFSMNNKDMLVKNMDQAIKYLGSGFEDPNTKSFLEAFVDGQRCSRLEGAILAAIMYLAGKIGRGKGERVSIILFSEGATIIDFGGALYYDATLHKDIATIARRILTTTNAMDMLGTNMAGAIETALSVAQGFGRDKMKMMVILTDGYPDDEARVRELVSSLVAPRPDLVVFAAGIGEEVNQKFMDEITTTTGGEAIQVHSLDELAQWYSNLARKLEFKGRR